MLTKIQSPNIKLKTQLVLKLLYKRNAVDATGVNGYEFTSSALSTLSVKGDSSEGTQTLQILQMVQPGEIGQTLP